MRPRVAVVALVLAVSVLAGCADAGRPRSGETFLVLVDDAYTFDGMGDDWVDGLVGEHCARVHAQASPASVKLTRFWHGGDVPEVVVVRSFRNVEPAGERPAPVASVGHEPVLREARVGSVVTLASPFQEDLAFANLTVSGGALIVDGERVEAGETWEGAFEYLLRPGGSTYRVQETVRVHVVGAAPVSVEPDPTGCD